jgi:Tfp pilus assembly protein PilX
MYDMNSQNGAILLPILLFIAMLTLFALSLANISLLEIKMSQAHEDGSSAFYEAANRLAKYEYNVLINGTDSHAQSIDVGMCGVKFYRIAAKSGSGNSSLTSTLAKLDHPEKCTPSPTIREGRQSLMMNEAG